MHEDLEQQCAAAQHAASHLPGAHAPGAHWHEASCLQVWERGGTERHERGVVVPYSPIVFALGFLIT